MKTLLVISVLLAFTLLGHAQIWKVPEGHETRWTSFENPTGAKGTAAQVNKGAKGSAFGRIMAGDSCVLLSQQGPGIINRIWLTVSKRNPKMLRALRIKFYWKILLFRQWMSHWEIFLGIRCHVHLVLRTVSFLIRRSVLLTVLFRCLTASVPKWCL